MIKNAHSIELGLLFTLTLTTLSLSSFGCNTQGSGQVLGEDGFTGDKVPTQPDSNSDDSSNPVPADSTAELGPSCQNGDSDQLCIALRYVVYKDNQGQSILNTNDVVENLRNINDIWRACKISFQIDDYMPIAPPDYSLQYQPANYPELDDIRESFKDNSTLLVVTTGSWNRSGSLGNTGANAWTTMPGSSPFGVVLERNVATYYQIIAHEIGHYLNLDHASGNSNLMSPIIYSYSTGLTLSQCNEARSAAKSYWQKMLR